MWPALEQRGRKDPSEQTGNATRECNAGLTERKPHVPWKMVEFSRWVRRVSWAYARLRNTIATGSGLWRWVESIWGGRSAFTSMPRLGPLQPYFPHCFLLTYSLGTSLNTAPLAFLTFLSECVPWIPSPCSLLCLDPHLSVKPPHIPGQTEVPAPLCFPCGHLVRLCLHLTKAEMQFLLQGAWEPRALKYKAKGTSSERNSCCPDDHCYDRGSRGPRPQSSESSTPSHPPILFQFQGPSLPCLNLWPQFCFISLILHLRVAPFSSHPMTNCLGRLHNGEREHELWLQAGLGWNPSSSNVMTCCEDLRGWRGTVPRHSKHSESPRSHGCWLNSGSSSAAGTYLQASDLLSWVTLIFFPTLSLNPQQEQQVLHNSGTSQASWKRWYFWWTWKTWHERGGISDRPERQVSFGTVPKSATDEAGDVGTSVGSPAKWEA